MITRRTLLAGAPAAAASMTGAGALAQAEPHMLRIGGGVSGSYPVFAARMADVLNRGIRNVRAVTLSGSTEQNLLRVARGEAEMSLSFTFQSRLVAEGRGATRTAAPDLRHMLSTWGVYFAIVARKGAAIASLADVGRKPLRVWTAPPGTILATLAEAALAAHGVASDDITRAGGVVNTAAYGNLNQAFRDAQVDVGFFAGPAPYGLLQQLDQAPGFALLPLAPEAARRWKELLPGVGARPHPGGLYESVPEPVMQPWLFNHVAVGAGVAEDLVYGATRAVWEAQGEFRDLFPAAREFDVKSALAFATLPVHPGAARYYREVGLAP